MSAAISNMKNSWHADKNHNDNTYDNYSIALFNSSKKGCPVQGQPYTHN